MTYLEKFDTYNWSTIKEGIYSATALDVERALNSNQPTLNDFKALISPAAAPYLEQMAQKSHALTLQRFGKTIQMLSLIHI